jgi:hypothetical protein
MGENWRWQEMPIKHPDNSGLNPAVIPDSEMDLYRSSSLGNLSHLYLNEIGGGTTGFGLFWQFRNRC